MHKKQVGMLVAGLATIAMTSGGLKAWAEQGEHEDGKEGAEAKVTLTAAQTKAVTDTALKAKPGKVQKTEAEVEKGKTICDVSILAADGKTYNVEVDVATNKVTEVEAADAKDDHEDGDEKDDDASGADKD